MSEKDYEIETVLVFARSAEWTAHPGWTALAQLNRNAGYDINWADVDGDLLQQIFADTIHA